MTAPWPIDPRTGNINPPPVASQAAYNTMPGFELAPAGRIADLERELAEAQAKCVAVEEDWQKMTLLTIDQAKRIRRAEAELGLARGVVANAKIAVERAEADSAKLEYELANAISGRANRANEIGALQKALAVAEADSARLREALELYGSHDVACADGLGPCRCGFAAARAAEQVPK